MPSPEVETAAPSPISETGAVSHPLVQTRSPALWRFTIREILLAMTAIGALLALGMRYWGDARTSAFYKSFDPLASLRSVTQRAGLDSGNSGGGYSRSEGPQRRRMRFEVSCGIKSGSPEHVLYLYRNYIRSQLDKAGLTIDGHGTAGDLKAERLQEFSYSYHDSFCAGEVMVVLIPSKDASEVRLFGVVYETSHR